MIKRYIPLIVVLALLLPTLFIPSCANTTEAPTGGLKDTIPPVIVGISPLPGSVNVPTKDLKIVFTFNEYVSIKEPKGIFLSPPQEKKPLAKIRGKNLEVKFEEELKPGITYTLDLGNAIADNNEGNPYAGFTFVFSTGSRIDSMYITGLVQDCEKLEPVKDATVMLYKDHSDSAVFLHRPDYATRTDEWGFFSMPYLQDTLYRIYAIKDETGNNIYDPESDLVGFVDSLIKPVNVVNDTTYELFKFDMKDTLECKARKTEYTLSIFKEKQRKQYIRNSGRIADRVGFVSFQASDTWIDSLWVRGYKADRVITQFNQTQDSLLVWLNDRRRAPDTLNVYVNYRKTDSLGKYVPQLEHLKLYKEGAKKRVSWKDIKHEDTICVYKLEAKPETVEEKGYSLQFDLPVVTAGFNKMILRVVNPKQKESFAGFSVERDTLDIRQYTIRPDVKIQPGFEYFLKVPERTFRDINGFWCDSTEVKVMLPSDDDLSSLKLSVKGVTVRTVVDLTDEKGSSALRSQTIDKDAEILFKYLKEGKYAIRISEDRNGNNIIDSGDLLEHRMPEMVMFYTQSNGERYLNIPKSADVEQTIDIAELKK